MNEERTPLEINEPPNNNERHLGLTA